MVGGAAAVGAAFAASAAGAAATTKAVLAAKAAGDVLKTVDYGLGDAGRAISKIL